MVVGTVSFAMAFDYGSKGGFGLGAFIFTCGVLEFLTFPILRYAQSQRFAAIWFGAVMWVGFLALSGSTGGILAPNLLANIVVLQILTLLLGLRAGLVTLLVLLGTYVGHFALHQAGIRWQVLSEEQLLTAHLAEAFAITIVTFGMGGVYEHFKTVMLERISKERARAEEARDNVRILLDTSAQGFFRLNRSGTLLEGHSRVVEAWLGVPQPGQTLWSLLAPHAASVAESVELGWEMVSADILPLDVALDQLPKRLVVGERHLTLEYLPQGDETDSNIVVVITDETASVARDAAERSLADLLRAAEFVFRDPQGLRSFVTEADRLVSNLAATHDCAAALRDLHTLKGNSALFGLTELSAHCHELEGRLKDATDVGDALRPLVSEWIHLADRLRPLLGTEDPQGIALDRSEYRAFVEYARSGASSEAIANEAALWTYDRLDTRLHRLSRQAIALAERLESKVDVHVEANALRVPPGLDLDPLWASFVHVLRNSFAHGIESPHERATLGKPERGQIQLTAKPDREELVIEITDDGRGIDWEAIANKARLLGLPTDTDADRLAALLADGVSTRATADELSGRGAGTSAVAQAAEAIGAEIEVQSAPGSGTTFAVRLPVRPIASHIDATPETRESAA